LTAKFLTFEEARERLGLLPFDQLQDVGRTTKILLEAVVQSQYSLVKISGYSLRYSEQLTVDAKTMAKKLGLNPDFILRPNDVEWIRPVVFTDHYQPCPSKSMPSPTRPGLHS
jgi:hypothetical protein